MNKLASLWHKISLAGLVLLTTACVSMPLGSMWKLRNLDILNTDPKDLKIAVGTNPLVQLQDGSTSLSIAFNSDHAKHNFSYKLLATVKPNAEVGNLKNKISSDSALTLFYLAEKEAEKLKLAQNRIRSVRDLGVEGNGSLSIDIHTGCLSAPPPTSLPTDIYAQFDRQQGFIKMQSNLDLMQMAEKAQQEFWVQCETTPTS